MYIVVNDKISRKIALNSPCLKHKLLLLPLSWKENPTYCSAVWAVSYESPTPIACGYLWLFIFKQESSDSSLDTETHWSPTSCSCSEQTVLTIEDKMSLREHTIIHSINKICYIDYDRFLRKPYLKFHTKHVSFLYSSTHSYLYRCTFHRFLFRSTNPWALNQSSTRKMKCKDEF